MQFKVFLFSLLLIIGCELSKHETYYYELNPNSPADTASVFARGVLSTDHHEHSAPTISPNGKEIYWSVWEKPAPPNPVQKIFFIEYLDNGWSSPKVAPFSGHYSEGGPFFSLDGKKLFFYSRRPINPNTSSKNDIDLWFVEKENNNWLEPERLSSIINDDKIQALPSLAANNNLYFLNYLENVQHNYGIYKSGFQSGKYSKPIPLPNQINSSYRDWTPFVSPEEKYLIFSSHRPNGFGSGDLYISFKNENGTWSEAINLGGRVNTASQERFPMVSPDGKILFFTRATESTFDDIYWVKFDFVQDLNK